MLLANKRVCEFIGKPSGSDPGRTCVYRIHDSPSPEKLITLKQHLETLEIKVSNLNPQNASVVLNQVLKSVKDKPEEHIIRTLIIRSMAKAVYSTENIGHYGLHFEYYSHFTSPIRRYPDLMLHRILQDKLDKKPQADAGWLEKACAHSSNQEKMAAEAERESIKYKQAEFMEKLIGEGFDAVITSVMQWGFYVEITANYCEGFVPARSLPDDDFTYVQKEMAFVGRKTKKRYTTGDKIEVIVNRVDILTREVELIIPESY
jgi:ribonuclease R